MNTFEMIAYITKTITELIIILFAWMIPVMYLKEISENTSEMVEIIKRIEKTIKE